MLKPGADKQVHSRYWKNYWGADKSFSRLNVIYV